MKTNPIADIVLCSISALTIIAGSVTCILFIGVAVLFQPVVANGTASYVLQNLAPIMMVSLFLSVPSFDYLFTSIKKDSTQPMNRTQKNGH